jgi:phenylacetate-coenzyme A ligase PaaK-like adenylate-forming protein
VTTLYHATTCKESCCVLDESCPCGETSRGGIWGRRMQNMISVQGRRVHVLEVGQALLRVPQVTSPSLDYVVVLPGEDRAAAALHVRVEHAGEPSAADIRELCVRALREELDVEAAVELVPRDTLERFGYKTNRVVEG